MATFPDAGPGRGKPRRQLAIQAHNCNKFYHVEQGLILSVADRAAARAPGRYCATSTATAGVPVPAARPGPADGFLRAIGFGGRKVADGWNPKAWNPPAVRPAWAHQATVR